MDGWDGLDSLARSLALGCRGSWEWELPSLFLAPFFSPSPCFKSRLVSLSPFPLSCLIILQLFSVFLAVLGSFYFAKLRFIKVGFYKVATFEYCFFVLCIIILSIVALVYSIQKEFYKYLKQIRKYDELE